MTSMICAWMVTSSAVVGSSAMRMSGLQLIAMAIMARWRMPPENSNGYWLTRLSASGMPTRASSSAAICHASPLPLSWCSMIASAICLPTLMTGLRLVMGSWKIIAMSLPRTCAHLVVADGAQVAVAEHERALDDLARRVGDEPHERERRDRLARAGLADDAQRLLAVEREADAVDGLDHAGVGEEVGREVLDREKAFAHAYSLSLGSVASRRPLPNEMKPNTVTTRAMLGKASIHQLPAAR